MIGEVKYILSLILIYKKQFWTAGL